MQLVVHLKGQFLQSCINDDTDDVKSQDPLLICPGPIMIVLNVLMLSCGHQLYNLQGITTLSS